MRILQISLLYTQVFFTIFKQADALGRPSWTHCALAKNYPYREHKIECNSVQKNKLNIIPHKGFKTRYLKGNFFAEYETDVDLEQFDYSIQAMPFIMNVISIVWISGNIYYIDEMDTELYHSLERVKRVFKKMYPRTLWEGELRVRKLVEHPLLFNTKEKERTALLFSGGIDSTSTAFAHLDKKQLLITAWGHWDLPLNEQSLWQKRTKKISDFAHELGVTKHPSFVQIIPHF